MPDNASNPAILACQNFVMISVGISNASFTTAIIITTPLVISIYWLRFYLDIYITATTLRHLKLLLKLLQISFDMFSKNGFSVLLLVTTDGQMPEKPLHQVFFHNSSLNPRHQYYRLHMVGVGEEVVGLQGRYLVAVGYGDF